MPPWLEVSIFALTLLVMLVGLFGLIVPIFPGITVIWLAALGFGVVSGFGVLGGWLFALITLFMLVGVTADNFLMGAGARKEGAAWSSILLGLAAGVIGTLLFPPLGGLVAAPLAILLVEYQRARDWKSAFAALRGLATGFGLAFVVRFLLGLAMIALWALWAWKG